MPINANDVYIGMPDQSTTGAIFTAPVGTTLPTVATATLDNAFVSSGYVSEDGLSVAPSWSTSDIKDWSGATVRKLIDSFDGEISWTELQLSYEGACMAFGANNVTKTNASTSHGVQLAIALGTELPEERAYVFKIKDGDKKVLIVVPRGQVSAVDALSFNKSNAVGLPIKLSALADASGKSIYIYTDDGVTTA